MHFFDKPYSQKEFLHFLQDEFLPDDFFVEKESIPLPPGVDRIQSIEKLGKVPGLTDLVVYELHHDSEHDPRVSLTRETFSLIKKYGVRQALAVYISENSDNYRFSLITTDFTLDDKGKAKREFSNPRRFSFFLGPDASDEE